MLPDLEQDQPTREVACVSQDAEHMDQGQVRDPSPASVEQDSGAGSKQAQLAGDGGGRGSVVVEPHRWWVWELFERTVRVWTAY